MAVFALTTIDGKLEELMPTADDYQRFKRTEKLDQLENLRLALTWPEIIFSNKFGNKVNKN